MDGYEELYFVSTGLFLLIFSLYNNLLNTVAIKQNFRNSLEYAPLREFDLSHQLSRLRQGRQISTPEATLIVQTLAQSVKSDAEVTAVRLLLFCTSCWFNRC